METRIYYHINGEGDDAEYKNPLIDETIPAFLPRVGEGIVLPKLTGINTVTKIEHMYQVWMNKEGIRHVVFVYMDNPDQDTPLNKRTA